MLKFGSDLDAPVRIVPTGTPDLLDAWHAEHIGIDEDPFAVREDEDPTYDPDGPHEELHEPIPFDLSFDPMAEPPF